VWQTPEGDADIHGQDGQGHRRAAGRAGAGGQQIGSDVLEQLGDAGQDESARPLPLLLLLLRQLPWQPLAKSKTN